MKGNVTIKAEDLTTMLELLDTAEQAISQDGVMAVVLEVRDILVGYIPNPMRIAFEDLPKEDQDDCKEAYAQHPSDYRYVVVYQNEVQGSYSELAVAIDRCVELSVGVSSSERTRFWRENGGTIIDMKEICGWTSRYSETTRQMLLRTQP
jgi:hypothetical protein